MGTGNFSIWERGGGGPNLGISRGKAPKIHPKTYKKALKILIKTTKKTKFEIHVQG